ncbi:MAG TPA: substrate-binding domain-containing protein [Bacillota bacterium]|nr:substrate-binding domain-containing protein [Bacillota bacterium]
MKLLLNRRPRLYLVSVLVLLITIITLWVTTGTAAPGKEHIRLGGRDIVLGDEGDSIVGRKGPEKGEKAQASGKGIMKSLGLLSSDTRTITVSYTCIGEKVLFEKVFPAFQQHWLEQTGEKVDFDAAYALVDFDKVATSVAGRPVQVLLMNSSNNPKTRGYTETKWAQTPNKGIIYSYPQVFLVRKGNPKMIRTFADLAVPGIQVIHLNPIKSTGGGFWPVYAIYGSALMEAEEATGVKDKSAAYNRLRQVEENAFYGAAMPADAMKSFMQGQGDVLVVSEFSALAAIKKSDSIEMVIPPNSSLADLVPYKREASISRRDEEVVDAFIDFLFSEEAQEYMAQGGFRPTNAEVLARHPEFLPVEKGFHLDYLGEATQIKKEILLDKWLTINNSLAEPEQDNGANN